MKAFFKGAVFKAIIAVCVIVSAFAIFSAVFGSASPASSFMGLVLSPFQKAAVWISQGLNSPIGDAAAYEQQIADLQAQLAQAREQLIDYATCKQENEQYREYLELKKQNEDFLFADAQVISRDSSDSFGSFVISKGSLDGVKVNDPVISGKYLVGRVSEVGSTFAKVRTILAPDVNVSATEIRSRETGVVSGELGLVAQGKCRLSYLERSTSVSVGNIICTSGIGGAYPKGLFIGTVEQVKNDDRDISAYAVLQTGVDIFSLSDVFVITYFKGQGIDEASADTTQSPASSAAEDGK